LAPLFLLFFLSGASGLIYEVLWMKELGVLFGNTAYAVATTLTVFFLGLSAGGLAWGRRSRILANPLRTYGRIELCIAATAGLYFFLLKAYRGIFPSLFEWFGGSFGIFVAVKFFLAVGILFLPAFFMGGTLPVMGQHMIRRRGELSGRGTLLYAVNTAGATLGTFLAGFILPYVVGIKASYLLAISMNVIIGLIAVRMARQIDGVVQSPPEAEIRPAGARSAGSGLEMLAFASGFLTLGLEVLWTRMFSQAHQNSAYLFSGILIVFLAALAAGSLIANRLSRHTARPAPAMAGLLVASALLVVHTPLLFGVMGGVQPGGYYRLGWGLYVFSMFQAIFFVIFVPVAIMGSILPFLLKMAETLDRQPGHIIGRLVAANTAGSLLGSLTAGFFFISAFGLSGSIRTFAALYALLGAGMILFGGVRGGKRAVAVLAILFVGFVVVADPYRQPLLSLKDGESLVDLVEGSHATLAVVRDRAGELSLRTNNHYGLGSAKNFRRQRLEAQLPLSLHPNPSSVFFLGLGTGITAGAALDFPVKKMTVCELMPEAVTLSKKHFTPYVNGLFDDPRVRIVVEDGRTFLLGTADTYDVIVADLFLPYRAGVGGLYSANHFAVVKSKLKPGGIFAQWLSIYQFSREDLEIIERTLLSVFDRVTVWRADFDPFLPFVVFICQKDPVPLNVDRTADLVEAAGLFQRYKHTFRTVTGHEFLTLYGGNLAAISEAIGPGPINTDNRPLIEFKAPVTIRNIFSGHVRAMNGDQLYDYFAGLISRTLPASDPYLAHTTPADREMVMAGLALFGDAVFVETEPERAEQFKQSFFRRLKRSRELRLEDSGNEAS
jgi:spermidine synthase